MKRSIYFLLALFFLIENGKIFSQSFEYISPKNNSVLVSLKTNIILKSSEKIDKSSLSSIEFIVKGSKSGEHTGVIKLSDDNETVLFLPTVPFSANENVTVYVSQGIKTISENSLPAVTIHFKTTPLKHPIYLSTDSMSVNGLINSMGEAPATYKFTKNNSIRDSLPSDFPPITVDSSNNPASGKIFIANGTPSFPPSGPIGNYIMILNNNGSVLKYRKTNSANPADFKVQYNGELSYADLIDFIDGAFYNVRWIVLDTTLAPIDTVQCGNGYYTDMHEFCLLPNGHALVLSDDPEPVDMRQYGGSKDAIVIGNVIQELDESKNVIFQWRSWDHIPITDSYTNLKLNIVDLIHGNSLEADNKGNIIFSMRHLSSIIKINRQTGDIDWILGGKENQFVFLHENESNSPNYFSYQHDARLLANGNLTLFDNGNQHVPKYSRAVEYKLDEQNKTADLVWEYRHNPDIYSNAMGSVQRLPNGNTLIGWGNSGLNGSPAFTEIHPDNSVALEMHIPINEASYRVYKFPWVSQAPEASVDLEVLPGNTYGFSNTTDTTGITITFNQMNSSLYANVTVNNYDYAPVNPQFTSTDPIIEPTYFNIDGQGITSYTGTVKVDLDYFPEVTNPQETVIYARSEVDSNFVLVPTSYDSTKKELSFATSTFGDFTFGTPQTIDSSYAPVPFSPGNADTVTSNSVTFRWGTYGIISSFHLQVATDPSFNNIVIDTSGFKSTVFTDTTFSQGNSYYWRVNNTNSAGTSNWSDTASFYISSTVGIENTNSTIPEKYYLSQNYPNPFNPTTIINYEIPRSSLVTLRIYDVLGREVTTLVNEERPAGRYNVIFNASKYSSGVYFYRITAGDFSQIKKMVLLK